MPDKSPHLPWGRRLTLLTKVGFLLAFFAFSAVFSARLFAQTDDSDTAQPKAIIVSSMVVELQDQYNRSRSFTGRASAKRRSSLGFEMPGTLKAIYVDDGDHFKNGDALAMLDTSRLNARLNELLALKEEITVNRHYLQNTYTRVKKTHSQGHASAQTLDKAYKDLMAGKARSQANVAAIVGLRIDIEKSVITAPFNGIITARLLDEGTITSGGKTVFTVIESANMEAKIGVTPSVALKMKTNSDFKLLDGQYNEIKGLFRNTIASIAGQTRTMLATFDLKSEVSDGDLITLVINDPVNIKGSWIPIRALSSDVRGLWRIYKISDEKSGPEIRYENVQLLYSSGDMAYVSGSFSDGDTIVREGVSKLARGQRVKAIPHKHNAN